MAGAVRATTVTAAVTPAPSSPLRTDMSSPSSPTSIGRREGPRPGAARLPVVRELSGFQPFFSTSSVLRSTALPARVMLAPGAL